MKNVLACCAMLAALAQPALAATPSTASLEELLVVTQSEKLLESTYGSFDQYMQQMMAQMTKGQPVSPEQQRLMQEMASEMATLMRQEMNWQALKPMFLQIYGESFTQEEIDGLVAFYKSPAGRAFVDKMPQVMQKTMGFMQERMGPLVQKLQASMQRAAERAKAARPPKPAQ